ncbi:hypothetical protein ACFE04_008945 [Oxalis oulophora]
MGKHHYVKNLTLTTINVVFLLLLSSSFWTCTASQSKIYGHARRGMAGMWPGNKAIREAYMGKRSRVGTFNVLDYGAKGDGRTDDSKAFLAAWNVACKIAGSTVLVPSGSVFLVGPVSFVGPYCAPNIIFQLDGKITAPTSASVWEGGLLQWIQFKKLEGITIIGKGIIDGQGLVWWNNVPSYNSIENTASSDLNENMPSTRPTALRFYGSNGVTVTGITIQNSPQVHLKFDTCTNVQVSGFTTSSPGDSPNTDGIHLQNTQDVVIYSSTLACGDDCVSIQTGCSNVLIHDVNCGPGHGISIGSLGKDGSEATVSNITVQNVYFHNTLTGVRIKTWQGGSGSVKQVLFENIQVSQVQTPIMIDQYYCDGTKCQNQTQAVEISDIHYANIKGTYTYQPIYFACSESSPCSDVSMANVQLTGQGYKKIDPFCWAASLDLQTRTIPDIDCSRKTKY